MPRLFIVSVIAGLLAVFAAACGAADPEVITVEKEVVVTKEVIKEVPKEVVVTKEVIKEVPKEIVVTKEVVKTVEVPVVVTKEVIKEVIKEVPKEVVVTKEVVKTVEVIKEVVKEVEVAAPVSFGESPQLAQLVAAGKLPPVADRLPSEPVVIATFDEIGKYGGDMRAAFSSRSVCNMERYGRSTMFRMSTDAATIIPHIAKSLDISPDGKVTTLKLREGGKWSDGQPFTADDFMFWWDHIQGNAELTTGRKSSYIRGINEEDDGKLVKVDDYTIQYVFPKAMTSMAKRLVNPCSFSTFAPAHFVKQFHKEFNKNADADAKEAGFDSWVQWFKANDFPHENPDIPVLNPWVQTGSVRTEDVVVFKRNPYYMGVDSAGNQLPYIDNFIQYLIPGDQERINLMVLGGETDFQAFAVNNADLPLFKQGEEKGGYRLVGHPVARGIWDGMYINFANQGPSGDLLRNVDFRRALSIAIDREAINNNTYLGLGEARQVVPLKESPFYPGDAAAKAWTQYDPDLANEMLDKIIPNKDSDGFRLLDSGERAVMLLDAWNQINYDASLQVPQYWEAVGVKTQYSGAQGGEQGGNVVRDHVMKNENMFMMYVINAAHPFVQNSYTSPTAWWSFTGPAFGSYYCGCHPEGDAGLEPTGVMKELTDLHLKGTTVPEAEQVVLGKEIFRRWAEDVYGIGLIGNVPRYAAVSVNLGNVPSSWMGGALERSPSTAFPEQFYWKR